tara:strand:+ start:102 stop:284 length:183 start_codon:yes stop_codon:yes gene_type:complete
VLRMNAMRQYMVKESSALIAVIFTLDVGDVKNETINSHLLLVLTVIRKVKDYKFILKIII